MDFFLTLILHICIFSAHLVQAYKEVESETGFVVGEEFHNTYGTADNLFKPFNDIHEEIEKCTSFTDIALADNIGGTANFYVSTPNYNSFKGVDLVPERKDDYKQADFNGDLFYKNFNFEDARYFNEQIKLRTCTMPSSEEGFTWTVQRLGPFESHGNYDWWQFGWSNLGNFKEILDKHPAGMVVDLQNVGPIEDGTWKRLEYPPIHIHHVHAIPDPKFDLVRQRTTFAKYNISLLVEQHGDYQCLQKDGGIGCLMQTFGKGNGKWFNTPLSVDGEMNDVRAPRSEKLKFWVEFALRWTTDLSKIQNQISFIGFSQPAKFDPMQQQTYVLTYPVPTDAETMLWYTAKMSTSGEMLMSGTHSHASVFHSSYFINASPAELGLDDPKFMPRLAFEPLYLKDVGFRDIREAATYFIDRLNSKENKKKVHPPKVICRAFVSAAIVNEFIYDRRPQCQCSKWTFKEGDDVTVIAFSKHEGYPAGAHLPDVIPKVIPNHAVWGMYYINHKLPYSTFSLDVYSQTGFFFGTRSPPSIVTVITMAILGGTFQASNRAFLDVVVPPIAIMFALLLLYLIYKCSRAIASSAYCSKNDIAMVKYSELVQTADDDDVKDA